MTCDMISQFKSDSGRYLSDVAYDMYEERVKTICDQKIILPPV